MEAFLPIEQEELVRAGSRGSIALASARTFVAGQRGLVGSAIVRALRVLGAPDPIVRTREQLDLRDAPRVRDFFLRERPDVVFLAAAKVGGIKANATQPWEFLYENLLIETSVLGAALAAGVQRVVFFGSSCIYPKLAPQPIPESALLTGPLEPTNEAYAIAKIAGLKLVDAACAEHDRQWVSLMPTNLYGPGDNFDLDTSHVLPAMIAKFHAARRQMDRGEPALVRLWGSGTPRREFLHVDDLARAALEVAGSTVTGLYNVGYGSDVTIRELAEIVAGVVGFTGDVVWDATQPDGTPRKLLDSSRIEALGWRPEISLEAGIQSTYQWFLEHAARVPDDGLQAPQVRDS